MSEDSPVPDLVSTSDEHSAKNTRNAVTVSASMNGRQLNVMLDTGAGPSLIDYGSLEYIGMQEKIRLRSSDGNDILNVSGDEMDIVGVVDIPVVMQNGKTVVQEFKVLNSKSHAIVLLGRDYMSKFNTVKFDFKKKKVQLGRTWINCVHVDARENVRLLRRTVLPARSETVISVRCKKNSSMQTVDFDPITVRGVSGVFVSKARVIPDVCGEFQLTVVNVNEHDVDLRGRTKLGFVQQVGEVAAVVEPSAVASAVDSVQFGDKLSPAELSEAKKLVKNYEKLFTENS